MSVVSQGFCHISFELNNWDKGVKMREEWDGGVWESCVMWFNLS